VYNSELVFWHGKALGELTVHGEELVGVGVLVMYTYREWIFLHESPRLAFFSFFLFSFLFLLLLLFCQVSFPSSHLNLLLLAGSLGLERCPPKRMSRLLSYRN
jgi:hypothetical protein